ncbi:response regulator transcription factor [Variovorax sp.]|uniref:response regulator transcription factor n=2 Tax=Variovorax sp. TaxID=1871043 RepID=UPI003D10E2A8
MISPESCSRSPNLEAQGHVPNIGMAPGTKQEGECLGGAGVHPALLSQASSTYSGYGRLPSALEMLSPDGPGAASASVGTAAGAAALVSGEPQFPIVALDDSGTSCPDLRKSIDRLGCASVAFDTLGDLMKALQAGDRFGLLLLNLPADVNINWLKAIRSLSSAPVLFVVNESKAAWQLRSGGKLHAESNFDFVFPPFDAAEIRLRVRNLLSRGASTKSATTGKGVLAFKNYRFQLDERKVFYEEREIALQRREYDLALHFFQNMDLPLARSSLNFLLRRDLSASRSRVLDVYVAKLRKKLRIEPANGLILKAVFGYGYELRTTFAQEFSSRW